MRRNKKSIVGNFINRTRFPVKEYVNEQLSIKNNPYPKSNHFSTAVIGAGCSGLYTAYRLN